MAEAQYPDINESPWAGKLKTYIDEPTTITTGPDAPDDDTPGKFYIQRPGA